MYMLQSQSHPYNHGNLTWMVCESDACPRISRRAGSETKKKRGNTRRFFSKYPVSDFWHSSNCSRRWGRSWPSVSSPTQHWTTLVVSCALHMILTQDLSMFWNLLASYRNYNLRYTCTCMYMYMYVSTIISLFSINGAKFQSVQLYLW